MRALMPFCESVWCECTVFFLAFMPWSLQTLTFFFCSLLYAKTASGGTSSFMDDLHRHFSPPLPFPPHPEISQYVHYLMRCEVDNYVCIQVGRNFRCSHVYIIPQIEKKFYCSITRWWWIIYLNSQLYVIWYIQHFILVHLFLLSVVLARVMKDFCVVMFPLLFFFFSSPLLALCARSVCTHSPVASPLLSLLSWPYLSFRRLTKE